MLIYDNYCQWPWPRVIKMTLTSKKYFQKIMLIYVNLLCIKYHLIKSHGVTGQNLGWETHQ